MRRTVTVWDQPVEIHVSRRYANVWVALGEFRNQWIEAKGQSDVQAATAWREAAKTKGNWKER